MDFVGIERTVVNKTVLLSPLERCKLSGLESIKG